MAYSLLESIREKARKAVDTVQYQKIGDSPTLKYYAKWYYIEELNIASHRPNMPLKPLPEAYIDKEYYTIVLEGNRLQEYNEKYENTSITEIGDSVPKDYGDFLFRNIGILETKLNAIHLAYFSKGIIVDVRKSIDKPVRIIGYTAHKNVHVGYHIVYILRDNVSAELEIISLGIEDKDVLKTFVMEGFVGRNVKAKITFVEKDSGKSFSYILHRVRSYDSSECRFHNLILNDNVAHVREEHVLSSKSKLHVYGLMVARDSSWQDYYTNTIHIGPYSLSKVDIKGVALDSSTITHRGLAKVLGSALDASSIIKSEMFVFGEKAKANSAPMLEIESNNVKEARHATSISRLSEDHIFYLATRGISIGEAEELVIKSVSELFLEKAKTLSKKFLGKLIYESIHTKNTVIKDDSQDREERASNWRGTYTYRC